MLKRLLIVVLLIGAGLNSFASEQKASSLPKPSNIILFFNFYELPKKSEEWIFLAERIASIQKQSDEISKLYREAGCCESESVSINHQKKDELNRLQREAHSIANSYKNILGKAQAAIEQEKIRVIIKKKGLDFGAGAVIGVYYAGEMVIYLDSLNNITSCVIEELNREYQESEKQIYPTCDLSPFLNRMKKIGSVCLK